MLRITGYKKYITREGDTFDALALAMYKDENMAYVIRQFNPDYSDVIVFEGLESLRIPVVSNSGESVTTLAPWRNDT